MAENSETLSSNLPEYFEEIKTFLLDAFLNNADFESSNQPPSVASNQSPGIQSPNSIPQASQSGEFKHANEFVNRVKNRFRGQPDIYKQFLEILSIYKKEQVDLKNGVFTGGKPLTEAEVYTQVANLFQNHQDLLQEFVTVIYFRDSLQDQFNEGSNAPAALAQVQGHQFQKSNIDDALSYIDKVKYKYANQPQVYFDFLDIMEEAKSLSLDIPVVIRRLKNLFGADSELIVDFHEFLPPRYKIKNQPNKEVQVSAPGTSLAHGNQMQGHQSQKLKAEIARSYILQMKYKYKNQPQVYNDFVDIMEQFNSLSLDIPGVIQRVTNLFGGDPEMIAGFNIFLPLGYKMEIQPNEQVQVSVPGASEVQRHCCII